MARRGAALAAALALAGTGATAAQAASYRYWSYWWAEQGAWTFATAGPASVVPVDGSIQGWRFGVTGVVGGSADAPAVDPSDAFTRACAKTATSPGRKRVAVVIDPGSAEAAPSGERPGALVLACTSIEESATGYQVLRSITEVRTEDGLVCAVGGYPSVGCAEPVEDAEPTSDPPSAQAAEPSPPTAEPATVPDRTAQAGPLPLIVAGLAIGAMLGFIWRRRRAK